MENIIQGVGLNITMVAQIINFVMLIIFLAVPIVLLVLLFSILNDLRTKVRKIEEILTDIKDGLKK